MRNVQMYNTTNNLIIVKPMWINIEINLILWMRACTYVFLYLDFVCTVGQRLLLKKNVKFSFGLVHMWAWPMRTPNLNASMHAHTFTHLGLIRKHVIMFNARQCVLCSVQTRSHHRKMNNQDSQLRPNAKEITSHETDHLQRTNSFVTNQNRMLAFSFIHLSIVIFISFLFVVFIKYNRDGNYRTKRPHGAPSKMSRGKNGHRIIHVAKN